MKKLFFLSLLVACGFSCSTIQNKANEESLIQYVDPLIGTAHCRWFHFSPGALPAGMAKPGPSTYGHYACPSGWEASGFDYRHKSIEGFPCLHEFQVGGVVLMPTVGELITIPGDTAKIDAGYRSRFDRSSEVATAGYYSVLLKDYDVKAEVTATERVAYQRFTFPKSDRSNLIFDIGRKQGESGDIIGAKVEISEDGSRVEGYVITSPLYVQKYEGKVNVPLYFSAVMDKKPEGYGTFVEKKQSAGSRSVEGVGAGAYLTYNTAEGEAVTAKVGLSYTSVENARNNRDVETHSDKLTFDEVKENSRIQWEKELGRMRVEGNNRDDKVKFYTGLYHAILGRGIASDVNGAYPRHDGSIGMLPLEDGKPAFEFLNTDAAWGAQWNLVQVWALAYPEMLSDFVNTQIQIYKDAGWLADGIACSRYVSGVGTNQIGNVIAAAYNCGIRDFDVESGYNAALKNEIDGVDRPLGAGKASVASFVKHGYVPYVAKDISYRVASQDVEGLPFAASHTLEFSFGAYAVAQMADALGKGVDYKQLMELSKGWEKIYNDETNFVQPKYANGEFIEDYNPMDVWRGFQEGNGWQYTFYVPHDVDGLVGKLGADRFNSRLDSIFMRSKPKIFSGGTEIGAFAGLQTLYNHGNQPCLHISWLFNEAGRPSLTQKWVRSILDKFYGTDGIHGYGYGQDEDQGQLGAWYVISSLGLFDVKGLCDTEPTMAVGSPLFDKVTIELDKNYYSGDKLTLERVGGSDAANIYVEGAELNGQKPVDGKFKFSDLTSGGTLRFTMGGEPNDSL